MQSSCSQIVLVIDDDRNVAEALMEVLESEGYEVQTADNGRSALNQLRGGLRPCAILLDLMMPVMDGWDFRHEQMRDADLKEIPVVVISAAGFSADTVRAQFGGVEYLTKPFELTSFVTTVRRFCNGAHVAAAAEAAE
ncbi:MAG TPA: response regulator [Polyangia bacterium]|nr:response regulator [Polyangia bacterium]